VTVAPATNVARPSHLVSATHHHHRAAHAHPSARRSSAPQAAGGPGSRCLPDRTASTDPESATHCTGARPQHHQSARWCQPADSCTLTPSLLLLPRGAPPAVQRAACSSDGARAGAATRRRRRRHLSIGRARARALDMNSSHRPQQRALHRRARRGVGDAVGRGRRRARAVLPPAGLLRRAAPAAQLAAPAGLATPGAVALLARSTLAAAAAHTGATACMGSHGGRCRRRGGHLDQDILWRLHTNAAEVSQHAGLLG
jgi:hypothetical protein